MRKPSSVVLAPLLVRASSLILLLKLLTIPVLSVSQPADLLAYRGVPSAAEDWSFAPFADRGAWFGFALPPDDRVDLQGGFAGPFIHADGRWASPQFARLVVTEPDGAPIEFVSSESAAPPGRLVRTLRAANFSMTQELWFSAHHTALVRVRLLWEGEAPKRLKLVWTGSIFEGRADLLAEPYSVFADLRPDAERSAGSAKAWRLRFASTIPALSTKTDEAGYEFEIGEIELTPGAATEFSIALTLILDGDPVPPLGSRLIAGAADSYAAEKTRWAAWRQAVVGEREIDDPSTIVAVKSLLTLVGNWRAPAGRFQHDGLFPSSNIHYFNGFWAWDSWKHAVATAVFDGPLAESQVRLMFDQQNDSGMIADVVYLDPAEDNWRDTKPPLAGWAIEEIYRKTGNLDFVRDLYPKLVAYHEFWYAERDHDGDGLCEYGSTDGTAIAARWESGMDNAVRFDDVKMLQNGPNAWSMDRESVDLNSYLYREKLALATLAEALERPEEAKKYQAAAEALRKRIQETMFDEETGWFYDVAIDSGEMLKAQGPEGWTPLWTGAASPEQAARVREGILDPQKFRTHVPFPTVSRDHPEFSDGYWRGLVWLDQAWFAIDGLRRYGYADDAASLTSQLLENLQGVAEPGAAIRENYHPLTGEGRNAKHFSWSAGHLLLLTQP